MDGLVFRSREDGVILQPTMIDDTQIDPALDDQETPVAPQGDETVEDASVEAPAEETGEEEAA